ncbi:response regulator [Nitrosococcus oceani]|uniref:Response regulator receiver n=2 Tax=Nitrosococcus oceani TaxID=1229 RepID=Q3JAH0_NITOC|nr:response regulator [Nitrosococcus oceani]KFI19389.1 response regulator [Nitrosococcus oceani C-27]ABA58176.1 Response regulator receiver [Nitrosococcus oceani ATCC 19707]EDZ68211.1 hypothetical protein NOC27_1538 [Nitrosococcus oceani AFC27]KFI22671.1 response regulator [Nitrosococcus oceani]GEM20396.1 response regulator [Nitrosococcus oceani]
MEILLVEDNPGDVRLTQEAFKEAKIQNQLYVVEDGVAAMEFLHQQGQYADVPRPHLILLDLNLPKKDGREVLREIKQNSALKRIPVVVLTTSGDKKDILISYDLHANCYITKPVELDQFIQIAKSIDNFWLTTVSLPGE